MYVIERHLSVCKENELRYRPFIPALPETIAELESLLRKHFKILWFCEAALERSEERYYGGLVINDLELECSFCNMKFRGIKKIFSSSMQNIFPFNCPNCNFPRNVLSALKALREKEQ